MKREAFEYYQTKLNKFSDKNDRIFERVYFEKDKIKKVHISAVCGKAMASIAGLFRESGYELSGSDADCQPPMSIILDNLNLTCQKFNSENLKEIDLMVVGNVCRPNNPEAIFARKNKIPQISGAEAIGEFFIDQKKSIVVAGTHGKTTTTSLLAEIFLEAEKAPAFLIGGVLQKSQKSYSVGSEKTEHFIIEGDEYDTAYFDKAPKFLHYRPYISLITSVEFDHADIYDNLNDYRQAFKFLIQETRGAILI
jgi:UDP-N-acetylmuramate: L-alanyl-gamma-D-glutamyl-meso-diaminopimelate ligase